MVHHLQRLDAYPDAITYRERRKSHTDANRDLARQFDNFANPYRHGDYDTDVESHRQSDIVTYRYRHRKSYTNANSDVARHSDSVSDEYRHRKSDIDADSDRQSDSITDRHTHCKSDGDVNSDCQSDSVSDRNGHRESDSDANALPCESDIVTYPRID